MKMLTFGKRTSKEVLRDPLTLAFGLGFPVVLLLLLSAIQANIPVSLFEIEHLTPGITVFGLSFMTLFSSTLVAKDRESAFLQRLYTTPLSASDFILGYALPLVPMAVAQSMVCYLCAAFLGLDVKVNILFAILFILPVSVFFIGLGLLFGSILGVKQVGGLCGALLTNITGFAAGIWFDLSLVGDGFKTVAYILPFAHAVDLERAALSGDMAGLFPHFWVVLGYAAVTSVLAVLLFLRQMRKQ